MVLRSVNNENIIRQGKTIAVVGNASSLFDTQYGNLIDSYDEVIRFNLGIIQTLISQGTKTTIIAYSYRKLAHCFPKGICYWRTLQFEERKYLKIIFNAKPSNGAVILERLKNKNPTNEVSIFGFDWNQTPTWCADADDRERSKQHNFKQERNYFLRVIEKYNWSYFQ